MLKNAICMTVPKFDPSVVNDHLYSLAETEIIIQMGVAYSLSGQNEEALDIFNQLLTYVRGHYEDVTKPSRYISLISLNYARVLCLLSRCKEAVDIAEIGRISCLQYGYCKYLPDLLSVMAKCWYFLNEPEKSKERYLQAFWFYKEIGHISGEVEVRKEMEGYFGIGLSEQGGLEDGNCTNW